MIKRDIKVNYLVEIQKQLDHLKNLVADSGMNALVFNTYEEMEEFLSKEENMKTLIIGQTIFIKDPDTPNYWFTGDEILEMKGQKIELSGFATTDDVEKLMEELNRIDKSLDDHSKDLTLMQLKSEKDQADGYCSLDTEAKVPLRSLPQIPETKVDLISYQRVEERNEPHGYCGLDSTGKVPADRLPRCCDCPGELPTIPDINLADYQRRDEKNAAHGYAGLDANSRITAARLPTTAEVTGNKNIANGYPGLDSNARIAVARLPTTVELTSNRGIASGYCELDHQRLVPRDRLPPHEEIDLSSSIAQLQYREGGTTAQFFTGCYTGELYLMTATSNMLYWSNNGYNWHSTQSRTRNDVETSIASSTPNIVMTTGTSFNYRYATSGIHGSWTNVSSLEPLRPRQCIHHRGWWYLACENAGVRCFQGLTPPNNTNAPNQWIAITGLPTNVRMKVFDDELYVIGIGGTAGHQSNIHLLTGNTHTRLNTNAISFGSHDFAGSRRRGCFVIGGFQNNLGVFDFNRQEFNSVGLPCIHSFDNIRSCTMVGDRFIVGSHRNPSASLNRSGLLFYSLPGVPSTVDHWAIIPSNQAANVTNGGFPDWQQLLVLNGIIFALCDTHDEAKIFIIHESIMGIARQLQPIGSIYSIELQTANANGASPAVLVRGLRGTTWQWVGNWAGANATIAHYRRTS